MRGEVEGRWVTEEAQREACIECGVKSGGSSVSLEVRRFEE